MAKSGPLCGIIKDRNYLCLDGQHDTVKQTENQTLFFEDKPIFGLDIGHASVRVLQLEPKKHGIWKVLGYGQAHFDSSAIVDGAIVKHEVVAAAIKTMFQHSLVGDITTDRVAFSLPVSKAFTRIIEIPEMTRDELAETVRNETEQYIPAASDSLYTDFTASPAKNGKMNVLIVAVPRKIVDSYSMLAKMLGITPVLMQTTNAAGAYLFSKDSQSDLPAALVDFGSESTDITVYDKGPIVNGTVASGGEHITALIQKALDLTEREATIVKTRYGLGYSKKQKQLDESLAPTLNLITREIKRTMRYYEERSTSKRTISQIVIMGGGANMPGLADYFTNTLRLPVRAFDPSNFLDFGHLQPFPTNERMSYVITAGLAMYKPEELFHD